MPGGGWTPAAKPDNNARTKIARCAESGNGKRLESGVQRHVR